VAEFLQDHREVDLVTVKTCNENDMSGYRTGSDLQSSRVRGESEFPCLILKDAAELFRKACHKEARRPAGR
jgi:hypothetical protein